MQSDWSFKSHVHNIVEFLDDEDKAPIPAEILQKELEAQEHIMLVVNSLTVVQAFVAVIQATMISFTWLKNDTTLEVATNLISFIGLTLDLIGTSSGVLHAISLQRDIPRVRAIVARIAASENWHSQVEELLIRCADEPSDPRPLRDEIRKILKEQLDIRKQIWRLGYYFLEDDRHRPLTGSLPVWQLIFESWSNSSGHFPTFMMMSGIICLIASIICFAHLTQHRSVWIACTVVTAVSTTYSLLPLVVQASERQLRKFFGKVDDRLELLSDNYPEASTSNLVPLNQITIRV